jgi:hypothetical protein
MAISAAMLGTDRPTRAEQVKARWFWGGAWLHGTELLMIYAQKARKINYYAHRCRFGQKFGDA